MNHEFSIRKKIYYHDTDAGGVVYYANYLKYLEEARAEFCLAKGISTKELMQKGIYFVVAHVDIKYKSSARYGDEVKVITKIEKKGRSSIEFAQEIKREDKVLVIAKVTWVCVNRDFKPRSIPDEFASI
ncbi:MAG: YbgC/FadM family acyl-CoA thioesterase [Candidatus Omnitrophota bacterium]